MGDFNTKKFTKKLFTKKRFVRYIVLVSFALFFTACSKVSGEKKTGEIAKETTQVRQEEDKEEQEEKKEELKGIPAFEKGDGGLSPEAEELCGSYFKAGDFRYRLNIRPGGALEREKLEITVCRRSTEGTDAQRSGTVIEVSRFHLPYEAGNFSYNLENKLNEGKADSYVIEIKGDRTLSLAGNGEEAGIYYSYKENLVLPDSFDRPLNDTDLIGLDSAGMRLVRNQFYAVYGRKFQSEDLKAYFESKPWYRGTAETAAFDEKLLGGLVKRNIAFLQAAEDTYDAEMAEEEKKMYESLSPSPYLELLPKYGEVLVTLASDREHAEDKGIYYAAEGTIAIPITLTAEEYKLLKGGGELEMVIDELTGEKTTLKKAQQTEYGEFVLGDEADGDYVMSSYHSDSGRYSLWSDSADTRFKKVYQGEIYVLKGASEEYYGYFDLPLDNREEAAGTYRIMDFDESGPYGPEPYSGNILVGDSKGYVKALYFWGD